MSVTARKLGGALLGVIATLPYVAVSCEDFAVLADDARYIVLSGDNLDELDVGSMWWLDIRGIDGFRPNSTFSASVLGVRLYDPETGLIINPRTGAAVIVRELGRKLSHAEDATVLQVGDTDSVWWVDNGRMDRIVISQAVGTGARIIIIDGEGNEISRSDIAAGRGVGLGVGCEDEEGRTIIGGLTNRIIVQADGTSIEPLSQLEQLGYRLSGLAMGCLAIAVRVDESAPDRVEMARIDLSANEIETEFATRRWSARLLFDEGQRMVEQELIAEQVEDANGYRLYPTRVMRVISTDDGRALVEAQMPATGDMSRLLCRGGTERFILSSEKQIYLVDAETLGVLASRQLPFERYFVF